MIEVVRIFGQGDVDPVECGDACSNRTRMMMSEEDSMRV